jgi:hypothetical protein
MIKHSIAIGQAVKKVLAEVFVPDTTPEFSPTEPQVAPDGVSPFDDETSEKIATTYKEQALQADSFEAFQNLLVKVATDLSLSVTSDLPKIAAILNKVRVRGEKTPL